MPAAPEAPAPPAAPASVLPEVLAALAALAALSIAPVATYLMSIATAALRGVAPVTQGQEIIFGVAAGVVACVVACACRARLGKAFEGPGYVGTGLMAAPGVAYMAATPGAEAVAVAIAAAAAMGITYDIAFGLYVHSEDDHDEDDEPFELASGESRVWLCRRRLVFVIIFPVAVAAMTLPVLTLVVVYPAGVFTAMLDAEWTPPPRRWHRV